MADRTASPPFGLLLAVIAGFLVAGVPLVGVAWHNVNHLLAGDVGEIRLLTALAATAGLGVLLVALARVIARWENS